MWPFLGGLGSPRDLTARHPHPHAPEGNLSLQMHRPEIRDLGVPRVLVPLGGASLDSTLWV